MESITDLLLSLCALGVFGGVFANGGMIVYLVLFSTRPTLSAPTSREKLDATVALADPIS